MTTQPVDFQTYVESAARTGRLVVQPRMGMSDPDEMAGGLRAVASARGRAAGTITIDSYTRVEDIPGAAAALAAGRALNGFPIVNHGPATTSEVAAATGHQIPVQVRHGSARPAHIFDAMVAAGLTASEGGPVSYCLPYSRLPLAEAVPAWADASRQLAETAAASGGRAHLETFGGCMLGQMCPPSLLIAISVLEAMFFAECGLTSVSLSYAQQTHAAQDIEALAALRRLAREYLPDEVARHLVVYTYMGVYPSTADGARLLLDSSAQIAVRGGADRLIVKTAAEAYRIPTVEENIAALERAAAVGREARTDSCSLPWARHVDYGTIYSEASTLIQAVLAGGPDVGAALRRAFADGVLDVPFCLHPDNAGAARGAIDDEGRLVWAETGAMPLPATSSSAPQVTSVRLLGMLRYAAEAHDRRAALGRAATPYRIAIVGSGPRGLAIAERLAARLAEQPPHRDVEVAVIDKVEVGAGRIWRTAQDTSFIMNTACGEVTMFSGPPDAGPARAGAGPSLGEWWAATDRDYPGPNSYAPRALYGHYLRFYLEAVESSFPGNATLCRVHGEVTAMRRDGEGWLLWFADDTVLRADRVVLATGHPLTELSGHEAKLAAFGARRPHVQYVRGDSAADMPLNAIAPGSLVAVLGMGLSFYDVVAALTTGRGGHFEDDGRGGLRYLASGREPVLIAGSRSGVPVLARGINQKGPAWRYRASLFTAERITGLRRSGPLEFRADVWPWLDAEMQLVYYATAIRGRYGTDIEQRYLGRAAAEIVAEGAQAAGHVARQQAARFGVDDLEHLDVPRLARPFRDRRFATAEEFTAALSDHVAADIAQARLGNHHGPLKAALDVLRDVRGTIRLAVDYGGLTARSHRDDFLGWFAPLSSFLAAGPPPMRLQQTLGLLDAGILHVTGPSARFAADEIAGAFTVSSPQVPQSTWACPTMIDARIPGADLDRDPAPLTRSLVRNGVWTTWRNTAGDEPYDSGGVTVTTAPYQPTDGAGSATDGLYVLGIPTEGQRWFMQVGSTRPGPWTQFTSDADAIASDILAPVAHGLSVPALDRRHA